MAAGRFFAPMVSLRMDSETKYAAYRPFDRCTHSVCILSEQLLFCFVACDLLFRRMPTQQVRHMDMYMYILYIYIRLCSCTRSIYIYIPMYVLHLYMYIESISRSISIYGSRAQPSRGTEYSNAGKWFPSRGLKQCWENKVERSQVSCCKFSLSEAFKSAVCSNSL